LKEIGVKRVLQALNLLAPFISWGIIQVFSLSTGSWEDVFIEEDFTKLLTPAPITFAIWGPIFLLLGFFYIYQARDLLPGKEEIEMPFIHQVSFFFLLSTIMATVWYVTWASRMIWISVASMYIYLGSILAAYFRLDINLENRPRRERLYVTAGWSMYAGWVTVATLVTTTTGLLYTGFENLPFTELQWTLSVSIIAILVYLYFLFKRKDNIFAAVGVWSLIGVSLTHFDPVPPSETLILITSIAGAVILAVFIVYRYIRERPDISNETYL